MNISRLFWIGFTFIVSSIIFIGGLLYIQDISIKKVSTLIEPILNEGTSHKIKKTKLRF